MHISVETISFFFGNKCQEANPGPSVLWKTSNLQTEWMLHIDSCLHFIIQGSPDTRILWELLGGQGSPFLTIFRLFPCCKQLACESPSDSNCRTKIQATNCCSSLTSTHDGDGSLKKFTAFNMWAKSVNIEKEQVWKLSQDTRALVLALIFYLCDFRHIKEGNQCDNEFLTHTGQALCALYTLSY